MSWKNSLNYEVRDLRWKLSNWKEIPNVFWIRERAKMILDIQNGFGGPEEMEKYQEITSSLRDLFVNWKNVLSEDEFDLIKIFTILAKDQYDYNKIDYSVFLQAIFKWNIDKINEFKTLLKENNLNLNKMWVYMFTYYKFAGKFILPPYKDFLKYWEIQWFDKNWLGTIKRKWKRYIVKLNLDWTLVETDILEEYDNSIPFIEDLTINTKWNKLQLATITHNWKVLKLIDWCSEEKFMKTTLGDIFKKVC